MAARPAAARTEDLMRRAAMGGEVADSHRVTPQDADDGAPAMADAIALTEAETWPTRPR